ncbi:hypothetical protein LQF12_01005 [Ruania suaedae]|uniref:hypothetical protein n=1 Tax=Ruania suaedae TaxID=2897774 RepID=UPI001E3DB71E|nr:hypothetical protein [Ruania suaedae]UFU03222.1 hypothetical protein LQF12_01005 [Ruania suaedae]
MTTRRPSRPTRPGAVTAAAVMTLLGAFGMTLVGAGLLALRSVAPEELGELGSRTAVPAAGAAILLTAALAIAGAIGALRRRRGAMVGLLALGAATTFGCVLALVYQVLGPQVIVAVLWIGVGSALLWQHRAWFSGEGS